jgi:molecular chaperone IbpA
MEDMAMLNFDPTPLWRSTIGFDRVMDLLNSSPMTTEESYPPYNIERTGEDSYRILVALAGFGQDDIKITAESNVLTIEGAKANNREREFLYQGISARPFRRTFNLADFVEVTGATFQDGILAVELKRELPEAMKPRRIAINASNVSSISHTKAA